MTKKKHDVKPAMQVVEMLRPAMLQVTSNNDGATRNGYGLIQWQ